MPQERKILPLISIYTSKSDYESIDKDIKKEDGNDECTGINLKLYILINLLCFDFTCLMYLFFIQFFFRCSYMYKMEFDQTYSMSSLNYFSYNTSNLYCFIIYVLLFENS